MSSSLIVEVCKIKDVRHHENSDNLDLAIVKGWQVVVGKGQFREGELVVYIPVDAILPTGLADRIGVRNHLGGAKKDRVKCARIRGEMSYGVIIPNENNWTEGTDVSEHYGITKYIPPVRIVSADAAPTDALFPKFTDVENINNFDNVFINGEEVIVSEKIDGSNCRCGTSIDSNGNIELKAGSMGLKRRMPLLWDLAFNPYWYPLTLDPVQKLLKYLSDKVVKEINDKKEEERERRSLRRKEFLEANPDSTFSDDTEVKEVKEVTYTRITLFGETFGGSIRGGHKSLDYGHSHSLCFAAFGLQINDNFLDWDEFYALCHRFGVPIVPVIDRTNFDIDYLRTLATGDSILAQQNGKTHMREGVVIYPVKERRDPKIGRVILKMLNPDYLILKNKAEEKGEVSDFKDE